MAFTPPPFNPASIFQDPSYLAYRAALGLESDTAISRLRGAQDTARRNAALSLADTQQQGILQRRNVSGSMESRGLTMSGEREKALAQQRAAEGRQSAAITANAGGSVSDLEFQIAQQRAQAARQAAETGFNTASTVQATAQGY